MGSTPATPPTPPPMACRPDGFTRFRGRVLALPACSCACSQAEEEADHLRRLLSAAQRDAEDARSRTDAMARQRDDALHYADEREDWASQAAVRRMHAVGPPRSLRDVGVLQQEAQELRRRLEAEQAEAAAARAELASEMRAQGADACSAHRCWGSRGVARRCHPFCSPRTHTLARSRSLSRRAHDGNGGAAADGA